MTNKAVVTKALAALSEHVSFEPNGGVEIPLYCNTCDGCKVWFNFPGKPAARNAYLANLNRYITGVLGRPIQVGTKNLEEIKCRCSTTHPPVIESLETLLTWGCSESDLNRLRATLSNSGLMLLQEYQNNQESSENTPIVTILLRLAEHKWLLPLYGSEAVPADKIAVIEALISKLLQPIKSTVTADLRELETC